MTYTSHSHSYSYLHNAISLKNHNTYLTIKIIDYNKNCYFEKNVFLTDIKLDSIEKYHLLVQNCIDYKPGFNIKLDEYTDCIVLTTSHQTDFLELTEKITLQKYMLN